LIVGQQRRRATGLRDVSERGVPTRGLRYHTGIRVGPKAFHVGILMGGRAIVSGHFSFGPVRRLGGGLVDQALLFSGLERRPVLYRSAHGNDSSEHLALVRRLSASPSSNEWLLVEGWTSTPAKRTSTSAHPSAPTKGALPRRETSAGIDLKTVLWMKAAVH
jgi:hypothetical protein